MTKRRNQRQGRAARRNVPRPPLGEIEPERPPPLMPRVIYQQTNDACQPVKILMLTPGKRNPMPDLPIWDHQFFFIHNPTNTLVDHQIWATMLNRAIPCAVGNIRYLALSCWERGMNAEQTRLNMKAVTVRRTRDWPMDIDEIEFWFRRFGRRNEDLEVSRSIEDLMREEAENWEELSQIDMVGADPYFDFDGGPLNFQAFESNRFDFYISWMSYGKRMPSTELHRRYAISLAFQHRYTVKRARHFLWGMWGPPEDERYPVETEEIEFWYRRFRMGHFREIDFELRKTLEELQLEEQGWLALGLGSPSFDWLGHYYLSSENANEIDSYNEAVRSNSKLVFRVSEGIAEPQDRYAPDSYIQQFLRRLPPAAPDAPKFDRPDRFITLD